MNCVHVAGLKLVFLGTGGATITPRPTCICRVCSMARARGIPYSRLGPAVFVQEMNALFDTPEDIAVELDRWRVDGVDHVFYSHWHPDHTGGIRVFEQLNMDISFKNQSWARKTTIVHLPPKVEEDFRNRLGLMEHLDHLAKMGLVTVQRMDESQIIEIKGIQIQCRQMANPSLYAYLLEEKGKRVLLALDDTFQWIPPEDLRGVDLAVLETGWFERSPDGSLLIAENNPLRKSESSFEQTLERARIIGAKRTILTHIEEISQHTYDDLREVEAEHRDMGISFAYDGLTVEI